MASRLAPPGMAAVGAVLIGLSLPPADITPFAWICLVPFLIAIRSCRSAPRSVACSIIFVLIFGSVFSAWLPGTIEAFFHKSPLVAWLSALGVYAAFGLVPIGLFAALAHATLRRESAVAILIGIPCLWVGAELFRVHLLGGLPWALLGHAFYRYPILIQIGDITGVFGVSFMVAMVNAGLFLAIAGPSGGRRTLVPLLVATGVVALVCLYGRARMAAAPAGPSLAVGILQPNRLPVYNWTRLEADRALISYLRLSMQHFTDRDVDIILWPENAIPVYPERDRPLQSRLARLTRQLGAPLILGAPAAPRDGDESTVFIGAHLITPAGLAGTYHKQRLVPFAEFSPVPRQPTLDPGTVFGTGTEPTIFTHAGIKWGPTICLDFMFSDVVRATVQAGAQVLVNLSNDSWLAAGGPGAAIQQHAQSVFRAVESKRDVARATTTGISAVVTATGEVRGLLGEGEIGALITTVTPRSELTVYTRWGDAFALGCAVLGLLCALGAPRTRRSDLDA
jgi:apolipoprotein N-acyltransferase